MTLTTRIENLLADVTDTNRAILRAKAGLVVELCGCGTITEQAPCQRCKRLQKHKTKKGKK